MPPPGFFSPLPYPPLPPSPAPTASPPPTPPSPTPKPPSPNPRPINPPPNSSESLLPSFNLSPPPPTPTPPSPTPRPINPPPNSSESLLPSFNLSPPPPPPPSQPLTEPPLSPLGEDDQYNPDKLSGIIAQRAIPGLSDPNASASPQYRRRETNSGVDRGPNLPGQSPQLNNRNPDRGQPDSNLRDNPETRAKKIRDEYLALFDNFFRVYPDLLPVGQTFSVKNVAYPVAACSDKLEGRALFGAVVQPQGSLRADPKMLMATGYPILDKAAIAGIESLTFPPATTHTLYQVEIEFKYDP